MHRKQDAYEKKKAREKGTTYLYPSTKGKPPSTADVRGLDPDTHRSRDGPGHEHLIVHRTDPDTILSVRGTDPDTGFLLFAGRPGDSLVRRTDPASSVHGPDPNTGFCAGRIRTQASLRVELAKMKLLQMFNVPRVGHRHAILGLQPDCPGLET